MRRALTSLVMALVAPAVASASPESDPSAPQPLASRDTRATLRRLDLRPSRRVDVPEGTLHLDSFGPSTWLLVTRQGASIEDFAWFSSPPRDEVLRYEIELAAVAGLRLAGAGQVLELLGSDGAPRLRVQAPWAREMEQTATGPRAGRVIPLRLRLTGCAVDTSNAPPWGRPVTAPGASRCVIEASWRGAGARYPLLVDPGWSIAGDMAEARTDHQAALLPSGRVLVMGGYGDAGTLASCEIYDPATSTWAVAAPMSTPRQRASAASTAKGAVVAGGHSGSATLSSTEAFDEQSGAWTPLGALSSKRTEAAAVTLSTGEVVIVGGADGTATPSALVDVLAPDGTWSAGPPLPDKRRLFTAVALNDGRMLVAGGADANDDITANVDVWGPGAAGWEHAGLMATKRTEHSATVLGSGKVLLAGGRRGPALLTDWLSSSEIFDPSTGKSVVVGSMSQPRFWHVAGRVGGRVIIAGGASTAIDTYTATAEVFDPDTASWSVVPPMPFSRRYHTGTSLLDGSFLVAGGYASVMGVPKKLANVERFAIQTLGASCDVAAECESLRCVDGVCCDTVCNGSCQACSKAKKGAGADGTCEPVSAGNDPDEECSEDLAGSCGLAGHCDGLGSCAYQAEATPCGPTTCESPDLVLQQCDGKGQCEQVTSACEGGFACDGETASCKGSCATPGDCRPETYCNEKACVARKSRGASCTGDQCQAGLTCVDGVCCESACDGPCEACSADKKQQGEDGRCEPVAPGADPDDDCAEEERSTCGRDGACDGLGACRLRATKERCADPICAVGSKDEPLVEAAFCDGLGRCVAEQTACGRFACASGACLANCSSDSECAPGFRCAGAEGCAPKNASTCSADGLSSVSADGALTACAPYRCGGDGACLARCEAKGDCAPGLRCDARQACVEEEVQPEPDDSGCACHVTGAPARAPMTLSIALLLALVRGRRRR